MTSQHFVAFRDVSFQYDSAATPTLSAVNLSLSPGFTGVVGANGAGKSTLLELAAGRLAPTSGHIERPDHVVYCEQRTDSPPANLQDFLEDYDGDAAGLRARLSIDFDFADRWSTLSHGERKRAQIGYALWQQPDLLLIDEPTNHIDAAARQLLIDALHGFAGIALLVSHDRDMLDDLCRHCVWLGAGTAEVYTGGYTSAREQRELDRTTRARERERAVRERDQLAKEVVKRREASQRANKERSKAGISNKDHDAKGKIDLARVSGKDGTAGKLLNQLSGRAAQAETRLEATRVDKERTSGISIEGRASRRNQLLSLPAGEIEIGAGKRLTHPDLMIQPHDRIALTGANGLGKSTLLNHLSQSLNTGRENVLSMPQEIDASESRALLDEARALPKAELGQVMIIVSRLGSDPAQLLDSHLPSPGEVRKLMLALGMAKSPELIIMDEPTNHLDVISIEALEAALSDCPSAFLLVSHDERFLAGLTDTRWELVPTPGGSRLLPRNRAAD